MPDCLTETVVLQDADGCYAGYTLHVCQAAAIWPKQAATYTSLQKSFLSQPMHVCSTESFNYQ